MPKRKNQALIDSDSSGSASESGSDLNNVSIVSSTIATVSCNWRFNIYPTINIKIYSNLK
jgi:hypothetical protein